MISPVLSQASDDDATHDAEVALLENLKARAGDLRAAFDRCSDHWGFEDLVYQLR